MITQLCIYATLIRTLAKGYLPISLIVPSKLREILSDVKTALRKINPDYDLVMDRLHLYYDMQLVMFGTNKDKNLIIQFPVHIQPLHTTATDIISDRNSTSCYHRSEYTGTIVH